MKASVRCGSLRWPGQLITLLLFLLFTCIGETLPAQAELRQGPQSIADKIADSASDTVPRMATLTVEGGGTLGAYEAGLTWALVEIFRQRRMLAGTGRGGETVAQQTLRQLPPF